MGVSEGSVSRFRVGKGGSNPLTSRLTTKASKMMTDSEKIANVAAAFRNACPKIRYIERNAEKLAAIAVRSLSIRHLGECLNGSENGCSPHCEACHGLARAN